MVYSHSHLQCVCHDPNHLVRVTLDHGDEHFEPEIHISIHLNPMPSFWDRLKTSFRYLFQIKPKETSYWAEEWLDVILQYKEVEKLSNVLVNYQAARKLRRIQKAKRIRDQLKGTP